mmetsp:Transcript_30645/g.46278  ORF Transcript_30645/g.46278 Transcript_30645/m.46278 type:complete len:244 (+) Transcript_30645:178-909(+)
MREIYTRTHREIEIERDGGCAKICFYTLACCPRKHAFERCAETDRNNKGRNYVGWGVEASRIPRIQRVSLFGNKPVAFQFLPASSRRRLFFRSLVLASLLVFWVCSILFKRRLCFFDMRAFCLSSSSSCSEGLAFGSSGSPSWRYFRAGFTKTSSFCSAASSASLIACSVRFFRSSSCVSWNWECHTPEDSARSSSSNDSNSVFWTFGAPEAVAPGIWESVADETATPASDASLSSNSRCRGT